MATTTRVPFKNHDKITVIVEEGVFEESPDSGDKWPHHKYVVEVRYGDKRILTRYSQGMHWAKDDVDAKDVLNSLVLDYRSTEFDSFEGWAADYGLDTDSRKAYAMYQELESMNAWLAEVFGADLQDFLDTFQED